MVHPRTKAIKKISEGVLAKTVDLVLVSLFYGLEYGLLGRGREFVATGKAQRDLEEFNYQTIKRAFAYLRQKGLIQAAKEKFALPEITEQGRKRLRSLIPHYDEKRIWDGRIYLVTYDLPVQKNNQRNELRDFLKTIGCGLLQESVWLTPYNPTKLLEAFTRKNNLAGDLILVSSLGKDGTVGGMDLPDLLEKVYHLSEVNENYRNFLESPMLESKDKIVFKYLSILRGDPQLPFKLLPEDWLGEKAYRLFQGAIRRCKEKREVNN